MVQVTTRKTHPSPGAQTQTRISRAPEAGNPRPAESASGEDPLPGSLGPPAGRGGSPGPLPRADPTARLHTHALGTPTGPPLIAPGVRIPHGNSGGDSHGRGAAGRGRVGLPGGLGRTDPHLLAFGKTHRAHGRASLHVFCFKEEGSRERTSDFPVIRCYVINKSRLKKGLCSFPRLLRVRN